MKGKWHWNKIALVVGLYAAALHAIWAIVVALGVGQAYLDWILPLHFISNMYTVLSFNVLTALFLVVMAFIGGYIATLLFIWLWKIIKVKKG
ncbi:Uncharacterised protein [uncultured archaeon]|nr:Uncharacterised protein [uncultured archaeon]